MSYRIAQSDEYTGRSYWKWSAWIEGTPDELNAIEYVVWLLHPTFHPSRIEIRSRDTQFRVDNSGGGTFRLRAELHQSGQEPVMLSHMLRLTVPEEQGAQASISPRPSTLPTKRSLDHIPAIFLSYSSEDEKQAQECRSALQEMGVDVWDVHSISPGLPINAAIRKMIRESDGVISIVGEYASPNVIEEVHVATAQEKPVVTLLPEHVDSPSSLPSNIERIRVGEDTAITKSLIAQFVDKLGPSEPN